jgi:hypothetical protein
MKQYFSLLSLCLLSLTLRGQASYEEKVTTVSNIGMTVSNLGIIGNSFSGTFSVEGFPSCEFPVGSGVEHIFDGAIWVGASINGVQTAVTTGAVDASSGYSTGRAGFEFSAPIGSTLEERSSLFDSPYYVQDAISHQDFVADFSDTAAIVPGTNVPISGHDNPLDIKVHYETYNWNYSFANFFVITNFRITNIGTNTLDDVYIGHWVDGVVRNVNITQPGGTSFYNKGGNGYIDSLNMGYEFDATGDVGFTESYVACKFLGAEDMLGFHHPSLDTTFKCNFNTWQFNNAADPLYFFPGNDLAKFGKLSTGLNHRSDFESTIVPNVKTPNNRSFLVSSGPYQSLAPGQSLDIAFAIVCAKKYDDGNLTSADTDAQKDNLIKNANWAQTAYNGEDVNFNGILDAGEDRDNNNRITRFILPSPPANPKVKIVSGDNRIDLYWTKNAEASVDPISKKKDFEGYRIYKSQLAFDVQDVQDITASLKLVGEFDKKGNTLFYNTGFTEIALASPVTFDNDTTKYWYKYSFEGIQNGWQHAIAVTSFDEGDVVNNLESLESSKLAGLKRVFAGKPGNNAFVNGDPFVYPNPYYAGASWEGSSTFEEDRKIIFANLPTRCEVRIYTVAGDLVDQFSHDENYTGSDIRWFNTYSNPEETQFSGGEHAWDLLSADSQIIARGIYLFAVRDLDNNKTFKGKFVVIK